MKKITLKTLLEDVIKELQFGEVTKELQIRVRALQQAVETYNQIEKIPEEKETDKTKEFFTLEPMDIAILQNKINQYREAFPDKVRIIDSALANQV